MDLETLIREVLHEHAADAPAVVPELRSSPVRRWVYAGLAAAVVAGLGVGITLVRGSDPVPRKSPPPPVNSPGPVLSTPSGYTRIAYHDLTVAVPEGLPVLTTPCSAPAQYVLLSNANAAYSCAAQSVDPPEQTLTITLISRTGTSAVPDEIPTAPTQINGLAAEVGYGTLPDRPGAAGEARFPDEDIAVIVTAPTQAQVETVLTSVRREADPNGCPAHYPGSPDSAADELVPAGPVSAVRCVYAFTQTGYVLQASLPVHSDALDSLVQAIDALPTTPRDIPQPAIETDLLRFDYSDGSSRTLSVLVSDPTSYSTGTRAGYDDNNVVTDQLRSATS
jgi:hypothetical protein